MAGGVLEGEGFVREGQAELKEVDGGKLQLLGDLGVEGAEEAHLLPLHQDPSRDPGVEEGEGLGLHPEGQAEPGEEGPRYPLRRK